ncbi:MAG: glutathione S-transferase [Gammaproteobacteria bacterium]|nr:glutathione S-transferase [Gammaproteobacteria bacterium]
MPKLKSYPVLYSFRRCPYAMRARMVIAYSDISVEIREVVLKDKPQEMLNASPKGTVPVLIVDELLFSRDDNNSDSGSDSSKKSHIKIIEESLDIMSWALAISDPDNINLSGVTDYYDNELVAENDNVFKVHLDHYKYAERFPAHDAVHYRHQGEVFLNKLNVLLGKNPYLTGDRLSVVDIAIFPFIRQFAFVDKAWFDQSCYFHLQRWLEEFLKSDMFKRVMPKLPQWHSGDDMTLFPFERENND